MVISQNVYSQLSSTLGILQPELGGILGLRGGVVREFYFDEGNQFDCNSYFPSITNLNRQILRWSKAGARFCGVIHSHPMGNTTLSQNDISFARKIIELNNHHIGMVYFPITTSTFDNDVFSITTYAISLDEIIKEETIIINDSIDL